MNPFAVAAKLGDRILAAIGGRTDTVEQQTHINHTLISVLAAGPLAAAVIFAVRLAGRPRPDAGRAFAIGIAMMLLWYLVHEIDQHRRRAWGWDGVLDVAMPLVFLGPIVVAAAVGSPLPAPACAVLWVGCLFLARQYWFARR